jgi:tRNA(Ile)-lysidine synthase
MPARTRFGAGELIRPLLGFTRAGLRAYAERRHLTWIEDPSNSDTRLRRNYLRAEVLPRLVGAWPEATAALARSAGYFAEALEMLDRLAESDLVSCRRTEPRYPWALSIAALNALTPARQRNLLRFWLRRQQITAPGTRHVTELLARIVALPQSRRSCVSWPGVGVWRYRDRLVALPAHGLPDPGLETDWVLAQPIDVPGIGRLLAQPSTAPDVPRLRAIDNLRVRLRRGGEILQLPGRNHHHALKKLIQAAGIPPWERPRLPLLYAGERLAAVADRWVCADFAAAADEPGFKIVWEPFARAREPENVHD